MTGNRKVRNIRETKNAVSISLQLVLKSHNHH